MIPLGGIGGEIYEKGISWAFGCGFGNRVSANVRRF